MFTFPACGQVADLTKRIESSPMRGGDLPPAQMRAWAQQCTRRGVQLQNRLDKTGEELNLHIASCEAEHGALRDRQRRASDERHELRRELAEVLLVHEPVPPRPS